jgi:hypothetical protein
VIWLAVLQVALAATCSAAAVSYWEEGNKLAFVRALCLAVLNGAFGIANWS